MSRGKERKKERFDIWSRLILCDNHIRLICIKKCIRVIMTFKKLVPEIHVLCGSFHTIFPGRNFSLSKISEACDSNSGTRARAQTSLPMLRVMTHECVAVICLFFYQWWKDELSGPGFSPQKKGKKKLCYARSRMCSKNLICLSRSGFWCSRGRHNFGKNWWTQPYSANNAFCAAPWEVVGGWGVGRRARPVIEKTDLFL